MRAPASLFKHPIHPMLIVSPIGLWIFSLACGLIRLAGASGGQMVHVFGVGVEGRERRRYDL
jgi:uncharacterized membrane protein